MRTCPKCMTENMDTDKFCKQCASPLQQSGGKTCPSGRHIMDPTWTECVYCRQENAVTVPASLPPVRTPTVIEGQAGLRKATEVEDQGGRAPLPPRPPRPLPVNVPPSPPKGGAGQPPVRQRESTVYRPTPTPNPAGGSTLPPSVVKDRKIVGILISYSWNP